jgi:hypothetical protein
MHGCPPTDAFGMDVVEEMLIEFQEQEERRSRLEKSGVRIRDLILGPSSSRVWLVDCLEEVIRHLRAKHAMHQEAVAKLEALWSSATRV